MSSYDSLHPDKFLAPVGAQFCQKGLLKDCRPIALPPRPGSWNGLRSGTWQKPLQSVQSAACWRKQVIFVRVVKDI